jgi:phage shock protein A
MERTMRDMETNMSEVE